MNINQALRRIAALKGEIKRLEQRRLGVMNYKADAPPAWQFDSVQEQIEAARKELIDLRTKVAAVNATTMVTNLQGESVPLLAIVNELQELKGMIAQWQLILSKAHASEDYTVDESVYRGGEVVEIAIAYKCDCPQRRADDFLTKLREAFASLNAVVETANHTTILG